jgi:CheY-like chemotaxis protein
VTKWVLIVDDNAFLRKALCETFRREPDRDVCGEAENGRDALEKAQHLAYRAAFKLRENRPPQRTSHPETAPRPRAPLRFLWIS